MKTSLLFLCAAVLAASLASAFAVSDNFDRPNNTDLGSSWTEVTGDWQISLNRVSGPNTSLITYNGVSLTRPWVTATAFAAPTGTTYVALVARYASLTDCVFVKVQGSGGVFTNLFFYYGNNGSDWPGLTGGSFNVTLSTSFAAARIGLRVIGSDVTAYIDKDFDGVYEESYTRGGLPTTSLGTGVGLGNFNNSPVDNFSAVETPLDPVVTPSSPTLAVKGKSTIVTTKASIVLKGTAADADGNLNAVEVKIGKAAYKKIKGNAANWSYPAKLKIGRNEFTFRAVDSTLRVSALRKITIVRKAP